ncbi:MAG TPA: TetR/AcrR family transcriptional regulator [Acetobacteraceae bacterium]|jgi:TetR/AcrR family transcriptional regulator, cholesterol catabolism regulator|nr:TetR/AcrR family transcriptional regulator [Acetobacteraceae bacterium]
MREEISAYKRERILEEAVKLFYERGFSGTTLDDIAGKLGVTKPFIYTHFRSKVELLEAICRPTIEMSLAAIADAAERGGSPSERLYNGVVDFTRVVLQRQANIAVYFREEKNLSEVGLADINALRKRFDRLLSDLLDEGAKAGAFTIADVRVAALAIGGMVSWAYTWYQPGGRLSIDDVGKQMAQFALEMVGVRTAASITQP